MAGAPSSRFNFGGLEVVQDMIEQDHWTDVGVRAHYWGGQPNETTCKSRGDASPSRIDGILANIEALTMIRKVYVIKDGGAGKAEG